MSEITLENAVDQIRLHAAEARTKMQKRLELKHEIDDHACQMAEWRDLALQLAHKNCGYANVSDVVIDDQGVKYRVTEVKQPPVNLTALTDDYNFDRNVKKCGDELTPPAIEDFLQEPQYIGFALTKDGKPTATSWRIHGKVKVIPSTVQDES